MGIIPNFRLDSGCSESRSGRSLPESGGGRRNSGGHVIPLVSWRSRSRGSGVGQTASPSSNLHFPRCYSPRITASYTPYQNKGTQHGSYATSPRQSSRRGKNHRHRCPQHQITNTTRTNAYEYRFPRYYFRIAAYHSFNCRISFLIASGSRIGVRPTLISCNAFLSIALSSSIPLANAVSTFARSAALRT